MALFKIAKGLAENLPSTKTAGYCWYTFDDSKFYIDYEDENGTLQRKALNSQDAETIMGASLATILSNTDLEIPTSKAVLDAISSNSSVDDTLTQTGKAADAKATGDAINQVQTNINEVAGLVGDLDSKYYTETEVNSMIDALDVAIDAKSYVQMITWGAND